MAKNIQVYEGLTASQIINRATSGVCTMSASGTTSVNCTDIKITGIKGSFGHPYSSLGSLCNSPNVNIYSNFGPVEWYFNGNGDTLNRRKTPFSMGNFAGYNHNAPTPRISSKSERIAFNNLTSQLSFYADIEVSEIDWSAIGAGYVKFIIKETVGGTILGSSITPINISSGSIMNIDTEITISGWGNDKSLSGELWLSNSGGDAQGKIPNCPVWNIIGKFYTNGVTSTISGAVGESTILQNGNYTLTFTSSGTPDVTVDIFNLYSELVATETIATQTSLRSFSGTLTTPLSNGYSIRFNILENQ